MMSLLKTWFLLLVAISGVLSAPKPKDTYVVAKLPGNNAGYGAREWGDYGMRVGGNVHGGRWLNHNNADVHVQGNVVDAEITNL